LENDVIVLAEQKNGELDNITYELLLRGREVADQRRGKLNVLILGHNLGPPSKALASAGVDAVFAADDTILSDYNPELYSKVISDTVRDVGPGFLLIGHTCLGIEMGPAVATRLEATLVTNCVDLDLSDGKVVITRPMYSGTIHTRVEVAGELPYIISFQKGVLPRAALPPRPASVLAVPVETKELTLLSKVIGLREAAVGEIDLTKADIIVSLGRGIGSKANVQLGKDLAQALGGVVGCSRHLADRGWLPPECHVGMEGKTVAPKVYLAIGISGATHHVGGIRDSDLIIAVNKDPYAPIFDVAHYGVVGDLFEIVPALIEEARKGAEKTAGDGFYD